MGNEIPFGCYRPHTEKRRSSGDSFVWMGALHVEYIPSPRYAIPLTLWQRFAIAWRVFWRAVGEWVSGR